MQTRKRAASDRGAERIGPNAPPGSDAGRRYGHLGRRRRHETSEHPRLHFQSDPDYAWDKFEGADLDRRRQARLLRQGAESRIFGQRCCDSGRYKDDLLDHDCLPRTCSSFGGECACGGRLAAPRPAGADDSPSANSGIRRMEATGPVTVISKTQVATGDNGSYDKLENKVRLIGHVTLSDGQNVTKGDKLTYDLKSGQATIDTGSTTGRVPRAVHPERGSRPDQTEIGAAASCPDFTGHRLNPARVRQRERGPAARRGRGGWPNSIQRTTRGAEHERQLIAGRRTPRCSGRASSRKRLSRPNGGAGRQHFGQTR